ncbi:MAG TPA: peptidoglycan DD-metalloendopeptidase family protein [Ignavibacteria bacterium]
MKYLVVIFSSLLILCNCLNGQTKAELEAKRKATLDEITYVDNMLKSTAKQKEESLNAIKIIGNKLNLRESVIKGMRDEIGLMNERIDLNTIAIKMMESDLVDLKNDYAKAVLNSYKSQKENPELVYILSAKDFNQGYKRLKYLQQITKFRRRESETIIELKEQIQSTKDRLQNDLKRLSDLKSREEQQKNLLQSEQSKKQVMVKTLSKKERQLQKELEEKKRIADKIEKEIARMMEEERKRAIKSDNTPEQRLIGDNFAENKGRLPWPVERGIVTSQFGIQKNSVLKYVTENNIGIEITSLGKTAVRSIFKGEVARVFSVQGANMIVIIRHGKYLSVYQNIVDLKIKPGDKVDTKQEIGSVFCEKENGDKSILKFMIFEEKEKLDPEAWISKN